MQITAVKPRRQGLSALYIDGEYAVQLDTQTLQEHRIVVGTELDDAALKNLIDSSNERRAREKALRLISYREHSQKELKEKIGRSCDAVSAERAVERMAELGLVDDLRFAQQYARKLLLEKKMTHRAAQFELSRKGVDRDTAEAVLSEIDADYRDNIRSLIEKKYPNIHDEKIKRRAVAALQRLGYSWEDIRSVLQEYENEYETNGTGDCL